MENDPAWIKGKSGLVEHLKKVWLAEDFSFKLTKVCAPYVKIDREKQCVDGERDS